MMTPLEPSSLNGSDLLIAAAASRITLNGLIR